MMRWQMSRCCSPYSLNSRRVSCNSFGGYLMRWTMRSVLSLACLRKVNLLSVVFISSLSSPYRFQLLSSRSFSMMLAMHSQSCDIEQSLLRAQRQAATCPPTKRSTFLSRPWKRLQQSILAFSRRRLCSSTTLCVFQAQLFYDFCRACSRCSSSLAFSWLSSSFLRRSSQFSYLRCSIVFCWWWAALNDETSAITYILNQYAYPNKANNKESTTDLTFDYFWLHLYNFANFSVF